MIGTLKGFVTEKDLTNGCKMEEPVVGVMKTLYNRRGLDGTDPPDANADGSSRD